MDRPDERQEVERRISRIEELIQVLEAGADPASRSAAQELVRTLMELHAVGLERLLSIIHEHHHELFDDIVRDEWVNSLLLLYDLHPEDLETRVLGALDSMRPYLKSHGGDVEFLGIDAGGVVRLRLEGSCDGCPSSAVTLQLGIEQAIREAAPDVTAIVVDGGVAAQGPSPALVQLKRSPSASSGNGATQVRWLEVEELGASARDGVRVLEAGGWDILFCGHDDELYAYADRCPACQGSFAEAELSGSTVVCSTCGSSYDVVRAGRGIDDPTRHLEPFPLLVQDGVPRVAVPAAAPTLR